jgi:nucleoside-diphosphate kinase
MSTYTFGMVKSHAVAEGNLGAIITMIEQSPLTLVAMAEATLDRELAEEFYRQHEGRPYFERLVGSVTSGPVYTFVLRSEGNAVQEWRDLLGPTDPTQAPETTIRGRFGSELPFNAAHGADSEARAAHELLFFDFLSAI